MEVKRFEWFKERFNELSNIEKINLYNDYCANDNIDGCFYTFDEEFFVTFFNSSYDAARATYYGSISWSDDYIRFDGRGNLESLSEQQIISEAEDNLEYIYEWDGVSEYIKMSEFEDMDDLKIDGDI